MYLISIQAFKSICCFFVLISLKNQGFVLTLQLVLVSLIETNLGHWNAVELGRSNREFIIDVFATGRAFPNGMTVIGSASTVLSNLMFDLGESLCSFNQLKHQCI